MVGKRKVNTEEIGSCKTIRTKLGFPVIDILRKLLKFMGLVRCLARRFVSFVDGKRKLILGYSLLKMQQNTVDQRQQHVIKMY